MIRRPTKSPPGELTALQRELNVFFERLGEADRAVRSEPGRWSPAVDVFEARGCLTVVVEVPGLSPDVLRVFVQDGQLVITGERRDSRAARAGAFLCIERPQGKFERKLPLDQAVELRGAEARLSRGLLTIVIPRIRDRRGLAVEIPVQRGE
jgi:HSP20 family protein